MATLSTGVAGLDHAPEATASTVSALPTDTPAAREGKDIFRLLVESVTDYGIFVLTPTGHIASWNSGAEKIKGYLADEIIGKHFSIFYPPEAVATGFPAYELEEAAKAGHFENEGWRLRKDGSRFWANVVITALRDSQGNLEGFAKVTRDLSERRRQEEHLRQSEEMLRLLVESVTDYAIYLLDIEGKVMSWNAGAARIKGYTAEEIIGQSFTLFYTAADVAAGVPGRNLEHARTHGSSHDEGIRVRKNGSTFSADVLITALYDRTGVLRGYSKVTRDLTQSKRVETLESEGQRINEFLAMLAHELRNPLAPIRNAVSLMKISNLDAKQLDWCRSVIDRQTTHITRLVDDLLDVSRITTGKIKLDSEELDLATLVHRGVESSLPLIESREHKLKVNVSAQPVKLHGDMTRLVQVLSNLLNNAAKYTPKGGELEIKAYALGPEVVIHVIDNGTGIPAELIDKVFDLFQQGDRALDRAEGGLGVGLTLVDKIVRLHDGNVEARSAGAGQGSEFIVRLPSRLGLDLQAAGSTVYRAPDSVKRHLMRILVVDDNQDAAETLAMIIRAKGEIASTVHEGAAAMAAARRFKPALVLLDLGLPGLDGYKVAQQFKADPELKDIKLVALTGYGEEQARKRAEELGFDDFLVKPATAEQITDLIGKFATA